MLEFDTAGPGWQDGDCDLLLIATNHHGFEDNLLPKWGPVGSPLRSDGNPMVDTDEKYLKILGTWYDKDRNPETPVANPAKEGKVIVDNTPPKVSGVMPGP